MKIHAPVAVLGSPRSWDNSRALHSIAFSPDGLHVVTGDDGGRVRLWEVASGQVVREFKRHSGNVTPVAFSPDGRHVLSGNTDAAIYLSDAATGELVREFKGSTGGVRWLCFSPDGRRALSAADDKLLRTWDVATGTQEREFGPTAHIATVCAFSADGGAVIGGDWGGKLRAWNAADGSLIREFEGEAAGFHWLRVMPLTGALVTGSNDGKLCVWENGKLAGTIELGRGDSRGGDITPDGAMILAAFGPTLRFWASTDYKNVQNYGPPGGGINAVAVSPDGSIAVAACNSGTIEPIDLKTLNTWKTPQAKLATGHTGYVNCLCFTPDGSRLLSGGRDGSVLVWDVRGRKLETELDIGGPKSDRLTPVSAVTALACTPDGRLALAATGGVVHVFSLGAKPEHLYSFVVAEPTSGESKSDSRSPRLFGANQMALAPDSRSVFVCIGAAVLQFELLHESKPSHRKVIREFKGGGWSHVALNSSGTLLFADISGTAHQAAIWNVTTGERYKQIERQQVPQPAADHHGWGNLAAGHERLLGPAFGADGQSVVFCGTRGEIIQWEFEKVAEAKLLVNNDLGVNSALMHPGLGLFLLATSEGRVEVVELAAKAVTATLPGHEGGALCCAVSPDGRTVATGGHDKRTLLWELE